MEENEDKGKVKGTEDTGERDKPTETEIVEQQSQRIKELETERDKRIMEDAKKQMAGTAKGGTENKEPTKTPREAAKDYIKENFENLR